MDDHVTTTAGNELVLSRDENEPEWARPIPEWVLDLIASIRHLVPAGLQVAVEQDRTKPGIWRLYGCSEEDKHQELCLLCGVAISDRIAGIAGGGWAKCGGEMAATCVCSVCVPPRSTPETRS